MDFASCLTQFHVPHYRPMLPATKQGVDNSDPNFLGSSRTMYPFPSATQAGRTKRFQVKIACSRCQKSCKKCDQARPCLRCVKYGYGPEECVDSQRKARKKGTKRGPYKKRRKGDSIERSDDRPQEIEFDGWSPLSEACSSTTSAEAIQAGYISDPYEQYFLSQTDRTENPYYTVS
ncbi:Zn(2)-C6 fungal-type domain-containing protein [Favolaschia claudopus]|uniref:Zn(2)-C6 fungal-type domain-containing protein n=1 Tax=Favolaschia claudopus TaxID=2862362 RepID=A0AAW0C2Z9_9AGAR